MSAHKAHRASLDPRASLAKKAIQETSVNKVLLGCRAISGCRVRRETQETSAHKVYRESRDPKEWLVRKAIREMSVHLVLIVVVLGVVVVVAQ